MTDDGIETERVRKNMMFLFLARVLKLPPTGTMINVSGRDGINLRDAWDDGPQAYLGITTSVFLTFSCFMDQILIRVVSYI